MFFGLEFIVVVAVEVLEIAVTYVYVGVVRGGRLQRAVFELVALALHALWTFTYEELFCSNLSSCLLL